MELPRIRIDNIDDICVLICYLIYSLGCPLTKSQLVEITSYEDAVNYFDFTAALEKAKGHLCIETDVDGEIVYSNSPVGIKAARELGSSLPLSIREKLFSEAIRVYTRDAMNHTGSFLAVRYIKNADKTCTVGITVTDENNAKPKYYLEVPAKDEQTAESVKDKVKSNPKALAEYLDNFFDNI